MSSASFRRCTGVALIRPEGTLLRNAPKPNLFACFYIHLSALGCSDRHFRNVCYIQPEALIDDGSSRSSRVMCRCIRVCDLFSFVGCNIDTPWRNPSKTHQNPTLMEWSCRSRLFVFPSYPCEHAVRFTIWNVFTHFGICVGCCVLHVNGGRYREGSLVVSKVACVNGG